MTLTWNAGYEKYLSGFPTAYGLPYEGRAPFLSWVPNGMRFLRFIHSAGANHGIDQAAMMCLG